MGKGTNYDIDARPGYATIYNGALGQVLRNEKGQEYFRRSPGVRAIIPTKTGLIIQCEKRSYLKGREWDYRLPGGKVFDSLKEHLDFLDSYTGEQKENMTNAVIERALFKEAKQEAGITINAVEFYHSSKSSSTVEHDLYYFIVMDFKRGAQELEKDEEIEVVEFTYAEVWQLLMNGKFSEDRTRAVLFQYLWEKKRSFIS